MSMQLRATATLGEKTIRTYQNEHGMCILEIEGIFLVGWADASANLVLPAELVAAKTFETAAIVCDRVSEHLGEAMREELRASAEKTYDEERKLRGMCSIENCDKPIAGWCGECPHAPKLCYGHLTQHCNINHHWPFYSTPTGRN